MEQECKSCRWWRKADISFGGKKVRNIRFGHCCRFPPQETEEVNFGDKIGKQKISYHSLIMDWNWCGEFKPKAK